MHLQRGEPISFDPPRGPVPVEEYLAAEVHALVRHEYVDGIVRAMPGASESHVLITGNLSEVLRPKLRGKGECRMLDQDVQIHIPATNTFTYPDAAIACPPRFKSGPLATLLNPKVIFEVLSPTTEAYDRGVKFRRYRSIESFQEYVLIDSDLPLIELFSAPGWGVRTFEGLDAVVPLDSVGLELPLRALYADLFT